VGLGRLTGLVAVAREVRALGHAQALASLGDEQALFVAQLPRQRGGATATRRRPEPPCRPRDAGSGCWNLEPLVTSEGDRIPRNHFRSAQTDARVVGEQDEPNARMTWNCPVTGQNHSYQRISGSRLPHLEFLPQPHTR